MDIDGFLTTFINGDYFLVFLALLLIILVVLIIALLKTRGDYVELLNEKEKKNAVNSDIFVDEMFSDLLAVNSNDEIDESKPLIKQIDTSSVKTYEDEVNEYQNYEEENAIISAEELNEISKAREEELGPSANQVAIEKYEEEQENKAIISYEQLLKNASNISLSYKEEKQEGGSPKVNKITVEKQEVTDPECYIKEEEFLKILKEFRINLE